MVIPLPQILQDTHPPCYSHNFMIFLSLKKPIESILCWRWALPYSWALGLPWILFYIQDATTLKNIYFHLPIINQISILPQLGMEFFLFTSSLLVLCLA